MVGASHTACADSAVFVLFSYACHACDASAARTAGYARIYVFFVVCGCHMSLLCTICVVVRKAQQKTSAPASRRVLLRWSAGWRWRQQSQAEASRGASLGLSSAAADDEQLLRVAWRGDGCAMSCTTRGFEPHGAV
jgi:hypothetical protein